MQFNEKAKEMLQKAMAEQGADAVWINVVQDENSNSIQMNVKKREEGDRVVEEDGLTIVMNAETELMLMNIKFVGTDEGTITLESMGCGSCGSCGSCGGSCGG